MGRAGAIGLPLPGLTAKLLPPEDDRYVSGVAGQNVMPGYFDDPDRTAESFDGEGFLITGDAVEPRDPAATFTRDDNAEVADDTKWRCAGRTRMSRHTREKGTEKIRVCRYGVCP